MVSVKRTAGPGEDGPVFAFASRPRLNDAVADLTHELDVIEPGSELYVELQLFSVRQIVFCQDRFPQFLFIGHVVISRGLWSGVAAGTFYPCPRTDRIRS